MNKTFTAVIKEGRGGGAFVEVPFDVKATFGAARPKVKVTFDGEPYRGTIAPMGGASLIGILKDIRMKSRVSSRFRTTGAKHYVKRNSKRHSKSSRILIAGNTSRQSKKQSSRARAPGVSKS